MKRIHIMGAGPRTGTTLLMEMMINCFGIDLYADHDARIAMIPPAKGEVFLTKSPKDIVLIEPILKVFKDLYGIYLIRDPRDMVVSEHGYQKGKYYCSLSLVKEFHPYAERLMNHPRFLAIKYEDLVEKPDDVQEVIQERMPWLKRRHNFSDFHAVSKASTHNRVAMGNLRPVDTNSVGNWKNHKPRVLGQLNKYGSIQKFLEENGYETDTQWQELLKDIEPDTSNGFMPFYQRKGFMKRKQRTKYFRAIRVWIYHQPFALAAIHWWFRMFRKHRQA